MSIESTFGAKPLNMFIPRAAHFQAALMLLAWAMTLAGADEPGRTGDTARLFAQFRTCRSQFAEGRKMLDQGRLDAAAAKFSACIKKMPAHAFAHYYLANILYLRQNYTEALTAIEQADSQLDLMMRLDAYAREQRIRDMDDVEILLARAYDSTQSCMERLRINEEAMQVAQEELKIRETLGRERLFQQDLRSEYACLHGNILFKMQRFELALERYLEAARANARNGQAFNNIIAIFYLAKRYVEADRFLQEAEAAGSGDQINLQLKMLLYQALQRPTAGILEEEYAASFPAEGMRAARFTVNVNEGRDDSRPLFENAYVAYDPRSKDALLIDPGSCDPRIEEFMRRNGLNVRLILNTHGHSDHSSGNRHFKELYQAKIAVGRDDFKLYADDPDQRGHAEDLIPAAADFFAGTVPVRVFPTPGHTPGSSCFLIGSFLFSGDSLFEKGVGRMDASDPSQRRKKLDRLLVELRQLIRALPASTWVLPGHGRTASLSHVLEVNPYFDPANHADDP